MAKHLNLGFEPKTVALQISCRWLGIEACIKNITSSNSHTICKHCPQIFLRARTALWTDAEGKKEKGTVMTSACKRSYCDVRPVFEFQFSGRTKTKQAKYAFAIMGEECEEFSVGGASAR